MELWDGYDGNFNRLGGITLVRGQEIPCGVYHLVCDVIVRHIDGSYLLMQRDRRKHYGLMWEASAGGSALKGETPLQCAFRELFEETGIRADRLIEVGRAVGDNNSIYIEYLCNTDFPKDGVVLQEGETEAYKWVSAAELRSMRKDELVTRRMQCFLSEICGAEEDE